MTRLHFLAGLSVISISALGSAGCIPVTDPNDNSGSGSSYTYCYCDADCPSGRGLQRGVRQVRSRADDDRWSERQHGRCRRACRPRLRGCGRHDELRHGREDGEGTGGAHRDRRLGERAASRGTGGVAGGAGGSGRVGGRPATRAARAARAAPAAAAPGAAAAERRARAARPRTRVKPRAIAVRAPVACRGPVSRCRPRRRSVTSAASAASVGVAPTGSASQPAARPQIAERATPARAGVCQPSSDRAAARASSTPTVRPGDTCVNGFCHGACVIDADCGPHDMCSAGTLRAGRPPAPELPVERRLQRGPDLRRRGLPGELPLERRLLHLHDRDRLRPGWVLRDAGRGVAEVPARRAVRQRASCVDALCSS